MTQDHSTWFSGSSIKCLKVMRWGSRSLFYNASLMPSQTCTAGKCCSSSLHFHNALQGLNNRYISLLYYVCLFVYCTFFFPPWASPKNQKPQTGNTVYSPSSWSLLSAVRCVPHLLITSCFQQDTVKCKARRQLLHKDILNKAPASTSML